MGPTMEVTVVAVVEALHRSWLMTSNCSMTSFSWVNTFTSRWPVIISSI